MTSNRQHLVADIAELRVLLKNEGYSRSVINAQLNELIKQNKALGGFEICDVCFWQYDEVAQNMPNRIIGPNKVSLNTAKRNYKLYGAIEKHLMNMVRPPYEDEI